MVDFTFDQNGARLELTWKNYPGKASDLMESNWKVKMFYKVYKYFIETSFFF